jgi:hypothetical protein
MRGTVQKLGIEGGVWALLLDDGRTVELIDCPEGLRRPGARAEVDAAAERVEVSIGMVGDAVRVKAFRLL